MITDTKNRILRYITTKRRGRPHDLALHLKISKPAVHRHLKDMVKKGLLEPIGRPPFTTYSLANRPYFPSGVNWIEDKSVNAKVLPDFLCRTRDVFTGRLERIRSFGLREEDVPLVIAISGEVGNNSFDHNLGKWRDRPGCWFEIERTIDKLWILIGDRGQGIRSSLAQVKPNLKSDQEALQMAFEQRVSGRAPERRGNGLKFVRKSVEGFKGAGVACFSGRGVVKYGEAGEAVSKVLSDNFKKVLGTLTLICWSLK